MPNNKKRIFATRPAQQNTLWAEKLRSHYATLIDAGDVEIIDLSLLEIQAVEGAHKERAKATIMNLDLYQKIIFVSQNAVNYGLELVDEYWPQFPEGVQLFAIGKKTQALVSQMMSERYPEQSFSVQTDNEGLMTSDALLAHEQMQDVHHEKIAIVRGVGGLPRLQTVLEQRGAVVDLCELYRRELPKTADHHIASMALNEASDVFALFSGETLENFQKALLASKTKVDFSQIAIIVPSERVLEKAHTFGFEKVYLAENASEPAMLASLDTLIDEK